MMGLHLHVNQKPYDDDSYLKACAKLIIICVYFQTISVVKGAPTNGNVLSDIKVSII